ncbi:MAG: hypothetical protein ACI9U0_001406 [Flavobacteriales bacterium]|jgi:hypothetical protein|tara:strand:- start:3580 stop:3996 length:417 start_codon:yes stop_codon:yes gene_type:complete
MLIIKKRPFMKKLAFTLFLFCGIFFTSNAQLTIEEQIADTACACINKADSVYIVSNASAVKMQCFSEALSKNETAIIKNYKTEQRSEADQEKAGIGGSLLINVENELLKICPSYGIVIKNLGAFRESSKAAQKMEQKK